jgi:hypothetical protein
VADLAPVIAELQAAGVTSLKGIAAALNDQCSNAVMPHGTSKSAIITAAGRRSPFNELFLDRPPHPLERSQI